MAEELAVSVVIPTFQRRESLKRALDALARQTLPSSAFEVVVAVDGSSDGTIEMLAQYRAPFPLRYMARPNSGRAAACNAGIEAAGGCLIVLLDDDMQPSPQFLEAHLAAHRGAGSTPRSDDHGGKPRRAVIGAAPIRLPRQATPVQRYMARRFNAHLERLADPDHKIGLRDVYTGNFSIERKDLDRVGLFNAGFTEYGNEDSELANRLRKAAVDVMFSSEAISWQEYSKSLRQLAADSFAKGRTAVDLENMHPDQGSESSLVTHAYGRTHTRALRRALLGMSDVAPFLPRLAVALGEALDKRKVRLVERLVPIVVDWQFWLGVRSRAMQGELVQRAGALPTDSTPIGIPEARRNVLLRSIDWRYLVGVPTPRKVVVMGQSIGTAANDDLVSAFRSIGAEIEFRGARRGAERDQGAARFGDADLGIAPNPSSQALDALMEALVPGGRCWIEYRARPGRTARWATGQVTAANLVVLGAWRPYPGRVLGRWPSAPSVAYWLTADDMGSWRHFIYPGRRGLTAAARAIPRSLLRTAWAMAAAVGLTGSIFVGAQKGSAKTPNVMSTFGLTDFEPQIRDSWAGTELRQRPARLSWLVQTGGWRSVNKLVAYAFAPPSPSRLAVVKLARVPESSPPLLHEADALAQINARLPSAQGVPKVLFVESRAGQAAVGETLVHGVPLWEILSPSTFPGLVDQAVTWLAQFVDRDVKPQTRDVSALIADFGTHAPVDQLLLDRAAGLLHDRPTWRSAVEHRDFGPWNIMVDREQGLGATDWESSVVTGLPLCDLVYFLAYGSFQLDQAETVEQRVEAYRRLLNTESAVGRVASGAIATYAARVGLDDRSIDQLRVLLWMVHFKSERERMQVDDPAGTPALASSLFVRLWELEARRAVGD